MEAAAAGDVKVLAVTVLTSLDRGDLDDLVAWRGTAVFARRALEAGCDGVVSSGLEAQLCSTSIRLVFARHPTGRESPE
jgi:orotidine-5'-phosphate decarboxylase